MTLREKYISEWERESRRKMEHGDFDRQEYIDWIEVEYEHLANNIKFIAAEL